MISGVRQSVSGMTERAKAQDVLANNLANIQTTGFKADRMTFAQVLAASTTSGRTKTGTPLDQAAAGNGPATPQRVVPRGTAESSDGLGRQIPAGPLTTELRTTIDLRPGSIQPTGSDYDLALDGPGFFAVQTPDGERYTRGGSFTLNGQGQLVDRMGNAVLTEGGPINAGTGRLMVTGDGMVSVGGAPVGKLRVSTFDGVGDLTRESGGLYAAAVPPKPEENVRVSQGYLEDANVNAVEMLTEMIDTMRGFDSNQRALREQLESMEKLVSEAGR